MVINVMDLLMWFCLVSLNLSIRFFHNIMNNSKKFINFK